MQRFNIPLRPGEPPVEFWYLPEDLKPEEAAKIARVIEALAEDPKRWRAGQRVELLKSTPPKSGS